MEEIPPLKVCEVLCAYVCQHRRCNVVVLLENIKQHLQRKHRLGRSVAETEAERLVEAANGKQQGEMASRYLKDPYPKSGESPLPVLPLLPVYDILKCSFCHLYMNGVNSCKSHMRSKHRSLEGFEKAFQDVHLLPLVKGQALFLGAERFFFPGTTFDDTNICLTDTTCPTDTNRIPIFAETESAHRNSTGSDEISIRERSANLTCSILGIPEFLDSVSLSLSAAYDLTRCERQQQSKLVSLLVEYIEHFANMVPPVPLSIVEGSKIRNGSRISSFSLSIEMKSKKRYAAVGSRFLALISKLGSNPLQILPLDIELTSHAQYLIRAIEKKEQPRLQLVHSFFRCLLLQSVRTSEGEQVAVEGLFKLMMAGYTRSLSQERVRVGDSDDASHTAAALQYFCHVAALGEYFVSPAGFGERRNEEENIRMTRIKNMLSTEACTPAAYLRSKNEKFVCWRKSPH